MRLFLMSLSLFAVVSLVGCSGCDAKLMFPFWH